MQRVSFKFTHRHRIKRNNAPSTMSTLMGGTIVVSPPRVPFLGIAAGADAELSGLGRFAGRRVTVAPPGDRVCGESGGLNRGSWLVLLTNLGAPVTVGTPVGDGRTVSGSSEIDSETED